MSVNHSRHPRGVDRQDAVGHWALPVPVRQIRVKLAVFAVLSLLAPTLGLPGWSQAALLAATVAIPAVVALHGGRRLLGVLLPATAIRSSSWRIRGLRSKGA